MFIIYEARVREKKYISEITSQYYYIVYILVGIM